MTKFNVGDKVRLLRHGELTSGLAKGGVYFVTKLRYDGMYRISKYADYRKENSSRDFGIVRDSQIEIYVNYSERLTEAEAEIETLKCQLYSIEKNLGRKIRDLETVLDGKSKLTYSIGGEICETKSIAMKTPNQRRADVIKRAQAFEADLERRAESGTVNHDGNSTFNDYATRLTFHVNAEKGVVTALARDLYTGELLGKAFAKCAPGDVFNADIGKAITAGRLYGVKVPKEFYNAPQPTEVVVGHKIEKTTGVMNRNVTQTVVEIRKDISDTSRFGGGVAFETREFSGWLAEGQVTIIDDTNAVYS